MTNRLHVYVANDEIHVEHITAHGQVARRPDGTLIQRSFTFDPEKVATKIDAGVEAGQYVYAAQNADTAIGFELPLYAKSANDEDAEFELATGSAYYGVEHLVWPQFL